MQVLNFEYSSDNPASRKKGKNKRIKTDKKNTSEKFHQNENDNQERSQKTASPSAYNKTGQQYPNIKTKDKTNVQWSSK